MLLAWKIEEVSFDNSRFKSYSISFGVHIVAFIILYLFAFYSSEVLETKLIPKENLKTMPISIVSMDSLDKKKFKKASQEKQLVVNTYRIEDQNAEAIVKIDDPNKLKKEEHKALVNPPKIERYEQLLAQHIANNLPEIPAHVSLPSRVDIWIKIDKNGDVYDFGVIPEQAPILEEILKAAVLDSSPVPTPSEESFSSNFAQYLIPLVFGDSN